jgi:hypothetical protein
MENGTFIPKSTMSFQLPRPLKDAVYDYSECSGETVSTVMRQALIAFLASQPKPVGFEFPAE